MPTYRTAGKMPQGKEEQVAAACASGEEQLPALRGNKLVRAGSAQADYMSSSEIPKRVDMRRAALIAPAVRR
jgi:hypothetical protein